MSMRPRSVRANRWTDVVGEQQLAMAPPLRGGAPINAFVRVPDAGEQEQLAAKVSALETGLETPKESLRPVAQVERLEREIEHHDRNIAMHSHGEA